MSGTGQEAGGERGRGWLGEGEKKTQQEGRRLERSESYWPMTQLLSSSPASLASFSFPLRKETAITTITLAPRGFTEALEWLGAIEKECALARWLSG